MNHYIITHLYFGNNLIGFLYYFMSNKQIVLIGTKILFHTFLKNFINNYTDYTMHREKFYYLYRIRILLFITIYMYKNIL